VVPQLDLPSSPHHRGHLRPTPSTDNRRREHPMMRPMLPRGTEAAEGSRVRALALGPEAQPG
jgi:hypothetical protein